MQIETWTDYLTKKGDKYLHFCHSEGAIITREALERMPRNLSQNIHIVAIGPAAYIDKNLCGSVRHYVSKRDIVPLIDVVGYIKNKDTITLLEPHPDAKLLDHSFNSPTYKDLIYKSIQSYSN